MIVVDSSVWIANLKGLRGPAVRKLFDIEEHSEILVGDLILLEVLQGARDDANAARIERDMRQFRMMTMLDANLAVLAARNYRTLRGLGVSIRKMADLIIGTFCIENRCALLHQDRDFDAMEQHLGLRIA